MEPLLIYPGELCYDARGFHCTRDEDADGHDLHCPKCHAYAAAEMTRETMTVYRYPRTTEPAESPEITARRKDPDDPLCARPGCTVEIRSSGAYWHACVIPAAKSG